MHERNNENSDRRLRVGSLFSGYGGLDLAVEQVFDARTMWFSEINEPIARVFAHHWPDAPNLGDITTIDWSTVEPVDVLCGGFPCQDVSTVGRMAGLAPGTRSGLWAHMATAIEALQPEWVVIENVRGLLSAPATRPRSEGDADERRNPTNATPGAATLRGLEPDPWGLGASPTSTGTWRRTRRPGRPPVRREMDRPTRFRNRRAPPPISHLHPRPPRSSEPRSPRTRPGAARHWTRCEHVAERSR